MMSSREADAVRVVIVEDLHFVAEAICDEIDRESGLQCVGILPTPDRLVEEADRLAPDIILLDLRTGGVDAFEAMAHLKRMLPRIQVIVVSGDNHPKTVERSFDLGASGYVVKHDHREIIEAIHAVAAGETWRPRRPLVR